MGRKLVIKSKVLKSKSCAFMKDIKKVFRKIENKLRGSSWFQDDWEIYNRGNYMQLYKVDWYNQNQGGVHFETYIETSQVKQKAFPICLHAENDCPSQVEFVQRFLEIEGRQIDKWKGYQRIGKGYSVCEKIIPLNFKNLEQRLLEEFNRLRRLELSIKCVLEAISNGK